MATALEGLLWNAESKHELSETRKGVQYYEGNPHNYSDWSCRIKAKIGAAKANADEAKRDQRLCELGTEILDSLSGEAFRSVRDLGDVIATPYGPNRILEALEKDVVVRKQDMLMNSTSSATKPQGHCAVSTGKASTRT